MDIELAYLAGFIDGEGCISINSQGVLMFYVSQLDPAPLILLRERFGGSLRRIPDRRGHRSMIQWTTTSRVAINAIQELRPFLIVKAEQADVALEYQRRRLEPLADRNAELAERQRLNQHLRDLKRIAYDHIELPENERHVADHTGKRIGWAKPKPPKKVRRKVAEPIRSTGYDRRKKPSAEVLRQIYEEQGLAVTARGLGVSRQTVINWLRGYGIPLQGRTEASERRRVERAAKSWQVTS